MTDADHIVALVLEADEEGETIKDILGPEYQEPLPAEATEKGVYRQDRWADVQIGDIHFCVSYLTPVAIWTPGKGAVRSDNRWSSSTQNHIRKWMDRLGIDDSGETMPQDALIELFKEKAATVQWTKREAKTLGAIPWGRIPFMKSGSSERVELDPHHKPRRQWED